MTIREWRFLLASAAVNSAVAFVILAACLALGGAP
jgi:hypothetical protein